MVKQTVTDIMKYLYEVSDSDKPTTAEEKLDQILENQKGSGFAVPSSKARRVNLSSARTQRLTAAQQAQALAFNLPDMQDVMRRLPASQNPIVRNAILKAGGRPAVGPRIKIDSKSQIVKSPKVPSLPKVQSV